MKATQYLALHSSKVITLQIQADMFRFSLCHFCKNFTSHNIRPKLDNLLALILMSQIPIITCGVILVCDEIAVVG